MKFVDRLFLLLKQDKTILILDQVMASACNFLLGILLIRWLGLEQYGVYAIAWMAVMFTIGMNQAWIIKPMQSLLPKEKAENQKETFAILQGLQWLSVSAVFVLAMGLYAIAYFLLAGNLYLTYVPILIGLTLGLVLQDFYRKLFFIKGNFQSSFWMDFILYPGQITALFLLYFNGSMNLGNTFIALLTCTSISVIFAIHQLSIIPVLNIAKIKEKALTFFKFAKWLMGTAILQWFSGNYFIIVAIGVLGPIAIGAIRMGQQVIGLSHVLFLAMENIVPVEAARRQKEGSYPAMFAYLKKITGQIGLLLFLILFTTAIASPQIIHLLYGEEYLEYSFVISSFCGIYIFVFLGYPMRFALRALEQTKPIFLAYVFGTFFSLIAANFMLQSWGIMGLLAGIGTTHVIALITYFFSLQFFFKNESAKQLEQT